MKNTLIGLFAVALIAVTIGASASPAGGKGMRGDAPRIDRLRDMLALSDEQVAEIREIRAGGGSRDDVRAVLTDEQREMLDTRRARRQGMNDDPAGRREARDGRGMKGRSPRMAHLEQALGLSGEQVAEIREIRAAGGTRDDIRAVLTDEQRALMDEHRANRQGRRDGKGGQRPYRDRSDAGAAGESGDPNAG